MNFEMKHHNKLFDFHPSIVNRFNNTLDFSFESQNTESPIVIGEYSGTISSTMPQYLQILCLLTTGVAVYIATSYFVKFLSFEKFRGSIGPVTFDISSVARVAWVAGFLLNLVTVSLPGRFDGISADEAQRKKRDAASKGEMKQIEVTMPWITLFEPAPWAFAIWGVIYLSELLLTGYIAAFGSTQRLVLSTATAYWVAGNAYQSIWCLCFRPQFRSSLWLPMIYLALGSFSFFQVHNSISELLFSDLSFVQKIVMYLIRFPISLHATWLAAATLLNLNAWVSVQNASIQFQSFVAYLSGFIALFVGLGVTAVSGDPFVALTAAWALSAVRSRTSRKASESGMAQVLTGLATLETIEVGILLLAAVTLPAWILLRGRIPFPRFLA